jgi:hypothetical protein
MHRKEEYTCHSFVGFFSLLVNYIQCFLPSWVYPQLVSIFFKEDGSCHSQSLVVGQGYFVKVVWKAYTVQQQQNPWIAL